MIPEETPATEPRSEEAIREEYKSCAMELGDKSYRCEILTQESQHLKEKMFRLNQELAKNKAEASKAAVEA